MPQGSISDLIGPNGTGKMMAFNLTMGLLAPTDDSLTLNGDNLTGKKLHQITQMDIVRMF